MAEGEQKVQVGDLSLTLRPGDGLLMFIWRGEDDRAEVHVPVLGRLAEGRIERHLQLLYRAVAQARSDHFGDSEARAAEMKEVAEREAVRMAAEQRVIKARLGS